MNISRNNRILIVDDSPGIHEDFRKVLGAKRSGQDDLDWITAEMFGEVVNNGSETAFELDSAFQGQQGLTKVRGAVDNGRPYALAFVDVRMPPGWDGVETIANLWQVDPDLEVVICSAYSDYGWDEIVDKLGKSDRLLVLKKPFEAVEVTQIAHALTRKWALQRAAQFRSDQLEDLVKERTQELEVANHRLAQEMKERQQMEAELRLAQKLEAIGQLAAGIAHEINTPIQYIGDNTHFFRAAFEAYNDLLEKFVETAERAVAFPDQLAALQQAIEDADLDYLSSQVPRAIEQTLDGVQRVSKIVRAMKDFSHPGSEDKGPVDINHALESTIAVARNEWKYVAEMDLALDPSLPRICGLGGELNQVFLNIIVNAAHAIGDVVGDGGKGKGTIRISTSCHGAWAETRISDTGTGIPEEIRDRIFDPFFTTKEVGKGTGQGLSIAHSVIVDKHDGQLDIETACGKGTTFIIRLPVEEQKAVA